MFFNHKAIPQFHKYCLLVLSDAAFLGFTDNMQETWNKGRAEPEATPGVFYGSEELQTGEYSTRFTQDDIFSAEDIDLLKHLATADSKFQVNHQNILSLFYDIISRILYLPINRRIPPSISASQK